MRYILLAVAFFGIALAIATTSVHAQLFAVGPDGVRIDQPMRRYYREHEHYGRHHEWARHHYRHAPVIRHDEDDEDDE